MDVDGTPQADGPWSWVEEREDGVNASTFDDEKKIPKSARVVVARNWNIFFRLSFNSPGASYGIITRSLIFFVVSRMLKSEQVSTCYFAD